MISAGIEKVFWRNVELKSHKVSIRGPLWEKAFALAKLEEMTVSEWVEDRIQDGIDEAGYGDSESEYSEDSDKED